MDAFAQGDGDASRAGRGARIAAFDVISASRTDRRAPSFAARLRDAFARTVKPTPPKQTSASFFALFCFRSRTGRGTGGNGSRGHSCW